MIKVLPHSHNPLPHPQFIINQYLLKFPSVCRKEEMYDMVLHVQLIPQVFVDLISSD